MPTLLTRAINKALRTAGLSLVRRPGPLLRHAGSEVVPTFPMIVADFLRTNPDPFLLQVGAFNGVDNDPVHPLLRRYGLRGAVVEPQPEPFAELAANYADLPRVTCVNAAVGATTGAATLYRVKKGTDGPDWLPQIASFNKAHLLTVPGLEPHVVAEEVTCRTFDALLGELGGPRVEILVVDAEGYDYELLRLFDLPRRKPAVVHYEHFALPRADQDACLEMLLTTGYRCVVGGQDTTAYLQAVGEGHP